MVVDHSKFEAIEPMAGQMVDQEAIVPALVVGTGLAGFVAALALACRGVEVVLAGPKPDAGTIARDTRSTALFGPSLELLRQLGVWQRLGPRATPLTGLRMVDATGGLLRAPEILFEANEIGCAAFGMNIENSSLLEALAARVEGDPAIAWRTAPVAALEIGDDMVTGRLADGSSVRTRLVVGADGAQSFCRAAAGIETVRWSYPQTAIATRFAHRRPHEGVSTELHRRAGPLTTVPLEGDRSSLVWVETPAEAERLMNLDDVAFGAELELRLGSALGAILGVGPRASFPLAGVSAERLGRRRVVLVGEAGHRLPPIGAQGLNLGARDAAWLADLVAEAMGGCKDPGSDNVIDAYEAARRGDVASRTMVVDVLNRSLTAGFLPIDVLRGAGLAALASIGPLRRQVMREGMAPSGPLPVLMQPVRSPGAL
jgi:2-octaprenyl-6-methoxyphenol hydroxylase